jgi:histone deacetylase 6
MSVDVHHGNGVQHAFYDNPNVLYISLHVHQNGMFYPNKPDGDHLHCGTQRGEGKNVNIPWADTGMGDGDYIFAFQQVVMPIAVEFDPDLVIISAGFDAADGDTLGRCHVTPAGYSHMTHMLMQLAEGKVAVCLEGGYNLSSIAKSALAVTKTLMGEPPERLMEVEPSMLGVSTVRLVQQTQSKYWKCMYPKDKSRTNSGNKDLRTPLANVIRVWQKEDLFNDFKMMPHCLRSTTKEDKYQILAT